MAETLSGPEADPLESDTVETRQHGKWVRVFSAMGVAQAVLGVVGCVAGSIAVPHLTPLMMVVAGLWVYDSVTLARHVRSSRPLPKIYRVPDVLSNGGLDLAAAHSLSSRAESQLAVQNALDGVRRQLGTAGSRFTMLVVPAIPIGLVVYFSWWGQWDRVSLMIAIGAVLFVGWTEFVWLRWLRQANEAERLLAQQLEGLSAGARPGLTNPERREGG